VWYWGVLRGLESVVATVLLIVVAVVGVVLVYLWFSGYLGKSTSMAGQAGAAERFKVESASLAADGTVRIYIRNLGGTPVNVSTIYVYPVGSLNPICVKHGVNAAISPGTVAAVETTLTCTTSPTPGGNYVIKVVTAKGTEIAYTITATLAHGGVGVGTGTGTGGTGGVGVVAALGLASALEPAAVVLFVLLWLLVGSGLGRLMGRRRGALTSLTAGSRRGVPPAAGLELP
jgi:FlaG/FlaF family flagellin (archaellin)